jgi:hypothetical protein
MREYLFIFGFESPDERAANEANGTDFESSAAVRILAEDEQQALAWGQEIADQFVRGLFLPQEVSWKNERFSGWIEGTPDEGLQHVWEDIPLVKVGEHPPSDILVPNVRP